MYRKPTFTEPNLDVLQLKWVPGGWIDFASIKTEDDMQAAIARVNGEPLGARIVRKQMGTTVIYPTAR